MPAVGQIGPDFALFNQDDHVIPLGRVLNNAEQVVVYFFPQPGAPGCTIEATGFRDIMPHLQARNVRLIGITTGPQQELRAFAKANNLNFDVVWDGDQRTSSEWGALRGEHAARMTFVLNYKGVVTHAWPRVNVYSHAAEVLAALGGPLEAAAPAAEQAAPAAAPVAQAAAPAAQAAAPVAQAAGPAAALVAQAAAPAAPAAAPAAQAVAPTGTVPAAATDLVMATVRAALQLLLAHQRSGGAVPQDVVDLTAQIALAAQLARR